MSSLASPVLRLDPRARRNRRSTSPRSTSSGGVAGGAFGDVWLARERAGSGSLRAIKHIKQKYNRWEECLSRASARLPLPPHRNVVRLFQLIHAKPQLDLYFVMEYRPRDLHQLTTARRNHGSADVQEVAALCSNCPHYTRTATDFPPGHQARESARSRAAKSAPGTNPGTVHRRAQTRRLWSDTRDSVTAAIHGLRPPLDCT